MIKGEEPSIFSRYGKQNFLPELKAIFSLECTMKLSNGDVKALGDLGLVYSFLM